jgi:hypothetical protein
VDCTAGRAAFCASDDANHIRTLKIQARVSVGLRDNEGK